ncbi:hypothetical protein GCM10007304_46150 [Rhodococcoides trifolii]|uniref:GIY-YIG catalytic domain-containing protein n=2 Tax=Rhodococcoides trifolii TaxID=908250 RepID=A0A917G7R4_9NOCA|nr:hypothetical protein GCM10007304_46150 [Rhodococcus trifolii]
MQDVPDHAAEYLAAVQHSRESVLTRPSPVPAIAGVYGWWFRDISPGVPADGCTTSNGLTLLYTGISPKKPPTNGKPPSSQTIRHRIRTHYSGNAEGSTLRRTLGCLLHSDLGIELRRYGSGKRYTFGIGEQKLSQWMAANAYVSWIEHESPWEVEDRLIEHLNVPLNLDGNKHNSFYPTLKTVRAAAVARANSIPVLANPGVGGR